MQKKVYAIILLSFLLSLFYPSGAAAQETGGERLHKVKYEIWAELDHPQRMLRGREVIRWHNDSADEINDVWFHLYWNAFKNEQSAMAREVIESGDKGIRFSKGFKKGNWGWVDVKHIETGDGTDLTTTIEFMPVDEPKRPHDQTVMRVQLPRPLGPGETLVLKLDFEAKIPRTIARAGYYHNSYFFGQWYPKPGVYEQGSGWNCHQYHQNSEFYADFAEFKVHMTVPREFVLGASGKEIEKKVNREKGTVTYTHWQDRIHDFAWTVDPDFIKVERDFTADREVSAQEYREWARRLQLPVEEIRLKDVKMILLINPEHRSQIDRHFDALRAGIKYYGLWYGAYPYETATLLDPPFRNDCGGMEYPTLSTAGTGIFVSDPPLNPEMVAIHEFGHNFWYGMIGNNEFEEAWLDEGINSYSDGKVIAQAYGPIFIPFYLNGVPSNRYTRSLKFHKYHLDRAGGILVSKLDPIFTHSWKFSSPLSYGGNVYNRAATCLYTLERILGEDTMLRVMRTFQMRYRFQHPVTRDFIEVVNEISGRDMSWFFSELFQSANEFDYGIEKVDSRKIVTPAGIFGRDGQKREVTFKQAEAADRSHAEKTYLSIVKARRFGEARIGGDVMLRIEVVFEDGRREERYWDGQARWTEFRFSGSSKIKFARVDPEEIFLIDVNLTNNSKKLESDGRGARRVGSKILFYLQNLLQTLTLFS